MIEHYDSFLARKMIRAEAVGLRDIPALTPALKPFQRDITTWALKRGRAAVFAGTGLGKTIQQLSWGKAIVEATSKPVLALAPLAVAEGQTPGEAEKFGIGGVAYAADQSAARTPIVVTNYDRIEKFDLSRFGGIILDESSIIKAHESKTRARLMELCKDLPYRLCCTATPAPNDYVELGNHAEFLGVLTQKEMLATWFVHDGSMKAHNVKNHGLAPKAEWRLKGHAEREFWEWVSTWAVMLRHPRELGYDEPGYDLPPLHKHSITVPSDLPMARTLAERRKASRASIADRVGYAAALVNSQPDRPWLIWCQLNDESAMLTEAIHGAVEVRGSDKPEVKAARLNGFAKGGVDRLVSKPSIAGWGMNFQRCADMVFVGLNDSFEELFQAERRCWRFGQTREVNSYMVASAAEGAVVANLARKEADANRMADAMAEFTRDLMTRSIRETREITEHATPMQIPAWLAA